MATRKQIQQALQQPYDRVLFAKEVLHPVFGSGFKLLESQTKPHVEPTKSQAAVIENVSVYATITLDDTTDVTFYEVTLRPTVRIEQSKVAIQQYVRNLLISGQAALINFVSPVNKYMWRFTLVARDSTITDRGIEETQTHPQRYTYLVEKDRPNRTMAERLEGLSLASDKTLQTLTDAFSVETMSKAFFDEYKQHYENFNEYLKGSAYLKSVFNGNEKAARDFIKKLMGRIVFLYFVQKKRWLGATTTEYKDGPYDFIYQLFKKTGGDENFFPIGLSKLFFEALNKRRPDDDWETPWGDTVKIPFLNGGLFVRDDIDELIHKKGDMLTFPANLFSDIEKMETPNDRGFLDFLNAFNFTVYEDSQVDHTVAVDPEMLGHIFENLLEDNKDKGAYYTPKEIVHYMCQESLTEYLATNLGKEYKVYRQLDNDQIEIFGNETRTGQLKMVEEMSDKALNREEIEAIVKEKDISNLTDKQLNRMDELLDSVKICDPAIGSGAFPMGLLQEIFIIKEVISHELHYDWKPDEVKEHIIQNSIYGVDIEKGAVDIAHLRFWLSLIVDIEKPKALPNLDYKIVVGDSLLSKVKIDNTEDIVEINWDLKSSVGEADKYVKNIQILLKEVVDKQAKFFNPNAKNKIKLKQEIRDLKIKLLINQLKFEKEKFQSRTATTRDIFEHSKTNDQLEKELRISVYNKLTAKLDKLLQEPDKPFVHFDWKLDFPEILNPVIANKQRGFNIVIANPPYVGQKGNKKLFEPFKANLKWKDFYERKQDIYYYFIAQAIKLTTQGGYISYINPPYFITAAAAKNLRRYIKTNSAIDKILNLSESFNVFDNVSINSLILFLKNDQNTANKKIEIIEPTVKKKKTGLKFLQHKLSKYSTIELPNSEWYIFKDKRTIEFESEKFNLLGEISCITPGIQTGADKINPNYLNKYDMQGVKKGDGIYVITEKELKSLNLSEPESYYIKPFYKNSELKKWNGNIKNNSWIIITNRIDDINEFQNIRKHLIKYKQILDDRYRNFALKNADKEGKWWFLYGFRPDTDFENDKILFPYRGKTPIFAYSNKPFYSAMDIYYITNLKSDYSYKNICSILNSSLSIYYFNKNCKKKGNIIEFSMAPMKAFPIPKISDTVRVLLDRIFDYVFYLVHKLNNHNIQLILAYFENIIDGIVYELYFPDLLRKYNSEITKHLRELPEFKEGMSDEEKVTICHKVFDRLHNEVHPVKQILKNMTEIPEITIIEGKETKEEEEAKAET